MKNPGDAGAWPSAGPLAKLFLVVADTTNLITDLCVEGGLFERLVCARARPPVGGLFYRSLGGILIIVAPNGAPCLPLMSLSCLPLFP